MFLQLDFFSVWLLQPNYGPGVDSAFNTVPGIFLGAKTMPALKDDILNAIC
jgi:hypothetical protein